MCGRWKFITIAAQMAEDLTVRKNVDSLQPLRKEKT
jgi:hypothetical protein